MRKKADSIQSNPRVFATLVLNCASGYYIYRLLSGVDGLTVQVSRVFSTMREAADNMFVPDSAWADVHDEQVSASTQQTVASSTATPPTMVPGSVPPAGSPGYVPRGRRPRQQNTQSQMPSGAVITPVGQAPQTRQTPRAQISTSRPREPKPPAPADPHPALWTGLAAEA